MRTTFALSRDDVCARTHRYFNSGLHESRSVIDSVTHHNDIALRLGETANEFPLVLGKSSAAISSTPRFLPISSAFWKRYKDDHHQE
jgi:hypothetical protein